MDNAVIATGSLGKLGIQSVPDLIIHESYTCGENFKQANNFLAYKFIKFIWIQV